MCHTCPSVADFELCEPVKKNYPLLKTLVSRLTSIRSQAGDLSMQYPAAPIPPKNYISDGCNTAVLLVDGPDGLEWIHHLRGWGELKSTL